VTEWGDGWGPTHQLHLESHTHIGCGFFVYVGGRDEGDGKRRKWVKIKATFGYNFEGEKQNNDN